MAKPKLEYTQGQYIHHGMVEANRGRIEALSKLEKDVVHEMAEAYAVFDEDTAEVFREVLSFIRNDLKAVQENNEYLDKVDARINNGK